ncbi:hypothetical protein F5Y17DRAFT_441383 [Xylariaceae sp. FL0594]|nr:hypothetical protein F5Y17DRAFT_441383 [Xylariaceae sp. FL0594]
MDALKNFVGGSSGSSTTNNNDAATTNATATTGQKDDYGDKGAAYLNQKYAGGKFTHDQLEKMTDAGRETYEKVTGNKVNEKFSN